MEIARHRPETKITPFWNRIPAFFLYGFKPVPLILATLSGILIYLTSSIWISVILYAVVVKYSMAALQHTIEGELSPPPFSNKVIVQGYGLPMALFFILLLYTLALGSIAGSVSPLLALLMFLLGLFLFPALVMCLGISESFTFSVNPIHWMALVKSIGWPYLALYGLYLSFGGAQATIEIFVLDKIAAEIRVSVWMAINSLFMIITFHLMGYVVMQYQQKLQLQPPAGREADDNHSTPLLEKFLQEGNAAAAAGELACLVNDHPSDLDLRKRLHNYAMVNQQFSVIAKYAPAYMRLLLQSGQHTEAAQVFSDCNKAKITCYPERAECYPIMFENLKQRRQFKEAVALMKDFHKRFPANDLTPTLYLELAKLFSEDLQRDDLAKKLLNFLLNHFKTHEKISQVQHYLRLIEGLSTSA
jgi:tetratricopeptide (TPR) repeat protein